MKKNIKYGASLLIIVLSLMLGYVAYANENGVEEGSKENRDEFMLRDRERKEEREGLDEESKIKRDEFKKEIENKKNQLKTIKEEKEIEFEAKIKQIKERREEFKTELENKRQEIKARLTEMRANFKEDLNKIKDENKKISAEKIFETIQALNTKLTSHFSDKVDQIENVLVGIELRIAKAESRGLDVSIIKTEVEKAKTAITFARDAISTQSSKVYEVNVTDEVTLKTEMKKLRDLFSADIKAVKEKVKLAHVAVRDTATALAKIPKIDEDEVEVETEVEVKTEVENNSNTTTNN